MVLVIIGLIVGGIVVGIDLIRAAELRSLESEEQKIVTAMETFRTKYNCLAGDCANATDFFGTAPEGCDLSGSTHAPEVATCNGDGDGYIYVASTGHEWFFVWQHLADAGLWPGLYRGSPSGGSTYDSTVMPPVSIDHTHYWQIIGPTGDTDMLYQPYTGNMITFFAINFSKAGTLTPAEAQSIDTKLDDGLPASGTIQAPTNSTVTNCTSPDAAGTSQNAAYLTTLGDKNCILLFLNPGF